MSALVVGGGRVATRKVAGAARRRRARARRRAGGTTELEHAAEDHDRLTVTRAAYSPARLGDATLVIAATDDAGVNAAIAARRRDAGQAGERRRRARAGKLRNAGGASMRATSSSP